MSKRRGDCGAKIIEAAAQRLARAKVRNGMFSWDALLDLPHTMAIWRWSSFASSTSTGKHPHRR